MNYDDIDFTFYPSTTVNPQRLIADQVQFYNDNGYLTGIRVFDEERAGANREYFDGLLERVLASGADNYSISGAHLKYGGIFDLVTDPKLLDVVEDILGPNFIAAGAHYFCKLPQDGKAVSWHQDASYWGFSPAKALRAWLAIDDVDTRNACMQIVPGSHLHGHLPFRESDPSENNLLNQTVEDVEEYGSQPVDIELKAGEISIHSSLVLHGSRPNTSDRRRGGIAITYLPADVRGLSGSNQRGIICRGEDPDGHWANSPRPEDA